MWPFGKAQDPVEDTAGGEELAAFIDAELDDERKRREVVDARGASLISVSTGLATLLFATAALVTAQKTFVVPRLTLWSLGATFLAFSMAAGCGLLVAKRAPTEVVTIDQLLEWRNDDQNIWLNTRDNVRWLLARAKIIELSSLRIGSNTKMFWVQAGWVSQLVALAALFVAVGTILLKAIEPGLEGWGDVFLPPG
jgi:hypothetical protein